MSKYPIRILFFYSRWFSSSVPLLLAGEMEPYWQETSFVLATRYAYQPGEVLVIGKLFASVCLASNLNVRRLAFSGFHW